MRIGSADFARMYGDPDEDYDSFEKCVVRVIDSTAALVDYLEDFLCDINCGQMEGDNEFVKTLRTQIAVCISLRESLKEYGLGIPTAPKDGESK